MSAGTPSGHELAWRAAKVSLGLFALTYGMLTMTPLGDRVFSVLEATACHGGPAFMREPRLELD